MGTLPSGTVTFLFTDIEGSTKLAQEYPDQLPTLLVRHHEILNQAIRRHAGFVFQVVGDSFLAAFHNTRDAVSAALEAQRSLSSEAWSPAPVKVRMGIHTGAAQLQDEGSDSRYAGYATLALAQRVMSAGHGGQILISQVVHDLLDGHLPEPVGFTDLGEHHLRDVLQKQRLFQLTDPALPSEFPPLKTQKILNHNLPVRLTSFIGRARELRETQFRLEADRLLTLVGPGGTGKTRLSIELGGQVLAQFPDGVWMIELARISDPALIPQMVAEVLGLRESPDRPLEELITDYLRAKSSLLILDNCEHLIEACAVLAERLLQDCPGLKILASSRESLGIAGEVTYRVPSLFLPDPARVTREALLKCESARLFVERASAANPRFELTDRNAASIAQICRRLDGIPLALELASARARVLSAEQIAERLDDRFRLLTGGSRTALPRQQTLQALIDWSYDLLTEPERAVFRRLAVFVGGWTLEAAESVCAGEGVEEYEVLDLLTQLVNKSLVIAEEVDGAARYRRLETIRQYARQKLLETQEALPVRNRHLEYFIQLSGWADEHWLGPRQQEVERKLRSEHDNFRAALAWALDNQPEQVLRLISWVAFMGLWLFQGYITEARHWTQAAVDQIENLPTASGKEATERARLLARGWDFIAAVLMNQGDHRASRAAAETSVVYARQSDDQPLLAQALGSLGIGQLYSGNPEQALASARESLALCEQLGLKKEQLWALNTMIHIQHVTGDADQEQRYRDRIQDFRLRAGVPVDPAAAERELSEKAFRKGDKVQALTHAERAFTLMEEKQDKYNLTFFQSEVAHSLREQGDFAEALQFYRRTIRLWQDFGHRAAVAHQLECFAFIALAREQFARASRLFGAAEELRGASHSVRTPAEQKEFEGAKTQLQSQMEEAEFDRAWEAGRSRTMEQAIELALGDQDD